MTVIHEPYHGERLATNWAFVLAGSVIRNDLYKTSTDDGVTVTLHEGDDFFVYTDTTNLLLPEDTIGILRWVIKAKGTGILTLADGYEGNWNGVPASTWRPAGSCFISETDLTEQWFIADPAFAHYTTLHNGGMQLRVTCTSGTVEVDLLALQVESPDGYAVISGGHWSDWKPASAWLQNPIPVWDYDPTWDIAYDGYEILTTGRSQSYDHSPTNAEYDALRDATASDSDAGVGERAGTNITTNSGGFYLQPPFLLDSLWHLSCTIRVVAFTYFAPIVSLDGISAVYMVDDFSSMVYGRDYTPSSGSDYTSAAQWEADQSANQTGWRFTDPAAGFYGTPGSYMAGAVAYEAYPGLNTLSVAAFPVAGVGSVLIGIPVVGSDTDSQSSNSGASFDYMNPTRVLAIADRDDRYRALVPGVQYESNLVPGLKPMYRLPGWRCWIPDWVPVILLTGKPNLTGRLLDDRVRFSER